MASSSLTPHKNNTTQVTFALISTSNQGAKWSVAGRGLSTPYSVEITRKINPSNSLSNDHVYMKVTQIERNETTGKLATGSVQLDISIPRDQTAVPSSSMLEILAVASSLLNDEAALGASTTNRTKLLEGADL